MAIYGLPIQVARSGQRGEPDRFGAQSPTVGRPSGISDSKHSRAPSSRRKPRALRSYEARRVEGDILTILSATPQRWPWTQRPRQTRPSLIYSSSPALRSCRWAQIVHITSVTFWILRAAPPSTDFPTWRIHNAREGGMQSSCLICDLLDGRIRWTKA